jgi:Na+/proline symporter
MPHVPVRLSSWVLLIGAALSGVAAAISAYTDAGGPGATYLSGLSGVLAIALGVLRSWQANTLTAYGATPDAPVEAGDPTAGQ